MKLSVPHIKNSDIKSIKDVMKKVDGYQPLPMLLMILRKGSLHFVKQNFPLS